jgi:hypothetical protein
MPKRRAIGMFVHAGRVMGLLLVILAIFGLPPMRSVVGRVAPALSVVTSVLLGMAGIVCLIAIQMFLRFFDHFLSRN